MAAAASMPCPHCNEPCEEGSKFCKGCGFPVGELRSKGEDPLIGQTLPGGHVVLELIDVGGMGRVYRAEQRMLGRTVAVKIIHPHLLGDETVEARFITEARAASQLNHPNSVSVIDFGKADIGFYMVMEYLRGRELAAVARDEGPFSYERIADVLGQVLAALEEAHHLGIVHRDLKPENIILQSMRSGADFVKVIDFGLAKVMEAAYEGRITNPGMVCGTPQYMAPEQARGDAVDARTDLYALGVVLYELIAGLLPFEAHSPNEIVAMQLNDPPPDPRDLVDDRDVPEPVVDVIFRALAKQPTERYQSAPEFAEAVRVALVGQPVPQTFSGELVRCGQCNSLVDRKQKFCGECGSPMKADQPPVVPALGAQAHPAPRIEMGDLVQESLPFELMGREEDLAWLGSRRKTVGSAPSACHLTGKVGVGKTRLLSEFAGQLEREGDLVLTLGPDPWRADLGYATVREAVRELAELPADGGEGASWTGASAEARAGLGAIYGQDSSRAAEERRRWSDSPPIHLKRSNQRFLVAEALRWALSRAQHRAGGGCVVVLLDDLDAIDGASRNAFADVVGEPPLGRLLLVAAHEPGFDPEWAGSQERKLDGLSAPLAMHLIENGPPASLPPGAMQADGQRQHLLPMYLEQVVRFNSEGGVDAPVGMADLIALRIERLPAPVRRVLQAIAVIGDQATYDRLEVMLPEEDDVERHVVDLERAGLVVDHEPGLGVEHPFIREVTVGSIPAEVRRRLHGLARKNLGLDRTLPLEAHALHAYHAQESFEALMLLEQVASVAAERGDFSGSIKALRLGLDLARREISRGHVEDPLSAILLFSCKLGDALALAGQLLDADGVLREALDLGGPRAEERPRILASVANVAHERGRDGVALTHINDALRLATDRGRLDLITAFEHLRTSWAEDAAAS